MNLTKKTFHKDDFSLLNKNLNFIPDPGPYNKKIFNEDLEKYIRRIILKHTSKIAPNRTSDLACAQTWQLYFQDVPP